MPDISLRRVDQSTAKPKLIVIFIHGLGGDPVSTWCHEGGEADGYFWPRWIAEKIEGCAVFTLGYPADKAAWNDGWPIASAAVSALDKLMSSQVLRECGDVPIAFVCHSLGGLIIKKLVVTAHLDRQLQSTKGNFLDRIAGVAFLATPHSGSHFADIAGWLPWFSSSTTSELKASEANLLYLSHSYRDRITNGEVQICHRTYYETEGRGGAKVVSHTSADPGLTGARPVGVKRDHMSICKPLDKSDTVYEGVLAFLQDEVLLPRAPSQTEKMDALPDAVANKVAENLVAELDRREEIKTAQSGGVERFVIMQFARRISADVTDFDQALLELERAVEIAIQVQAEGARGSNNSGFVDEVLRRVAELSARGQHKDAGAEADKAYSQWEREEQERQEVSLQVGLTLLNSAINQALLDRDVTTAAERIASKSDLETLDTGARFQALRLSQDEYYVRGRDIGLKLDLEIAIALARIVLLRARGSDQRGDALNDLALALNIPGERENGTARLEEAVMACHSALQELSQDRVPLQWAATQNNLGTTLWKLGERESGTRRLNEAVVALRAALEEYQRDQLPYEWAMTQNNLGTALNTLGERENSTSRLEEAVVAFHAALQERTRDRFPHDWAMTQNNLGTALSRLGGRESGTARLNDAVIAFRAALEEFSPDRVPLLWAMAQHNLGAILWTIGMRENDTSRIVEAVLAFDQSLKETCDRAPFQWAMTFGDQGVAIMAISERRNDLALAQRALGQIDVAFNKMQTGNHGPFAAYFEKHLLAARTLFAKLGG